MSTPHTAPHGPTGDGEPDQRPDEPAELRPVTFTPSASGVRRPDRAFRRKDVYTRPVVDGKQLRDSAWRRLASSARCLFISQAAQAEATLEGRLRLRPGVTRTNTIAVLSPKGGVGKTTCTFLAGNLLASHLQLRTLAIDANPDFGTLGALAPDSVRSERNLADVIAEMNTISSASELYPYISPMPSGLHVLAAPAHAEVMAQMTPELYGRLVAFLGRFYDAVLLDLGTGITDPIAQFALTRADQTVVVTTPEFVTASTVLGALRHLHGERASEHLTVVLNQAPATKAAERHVIEGEFRRQNLARRVIVPYDEQLRTMLDSGTYSLEGLGRPTRMPVKELGLHVAEQLV